MRGLVNLVLYASLAFGANAGLAADIQSLEAMRDGTMRKLVFSEPIQAPDTVFVREDGSEGRLSDYAGKHVVLNFWATWCTPCRKEMPHLSALQTEFGGPAFEVVTIATGRNPDAAMNRFFAEIGVENLPRHRDPTQVLARQMAVLGLPTTIILDPEGREIARMRGDADWASESARAIVSALVASDS